MGLNAAQQAILAEEGIVLADQATENAQEQAIIDEQGKIAGSQKMRTFMQGVSMGWSDEVEGAIASMFSDNTYDEERDAIRAKLNAYKAANPNEALSLEVIGAIVPMFTPVGWLAKGAGVSATAARAFLAAGTEGTIYGAGISEGENVGEVSGDAVTGAVTSLTSGGGLWLAGKGIKGIGSEVYNWARKRLGDKPADVVEAELARLVNLTGKSVDEVVADIASGRIMANNQTLTIAIKTIINEGGDAGRAALAMASSNASTTAGKAKATLQKIFSPKSMTDDNNIVKYMEATEEALTQAERKAYGGAMDGVEEVTPEIQGMLQNLIVRYPTAAKELKALYTEMGLGDDAFIKSDKNGNIILNKMASLEDAESMLRVLKENLNTMFLRGKNSRAINLKEIADDLQKKLDVTYPDLGAARSQAAIVRSAQRAYKQGKAFFGTGKNVEELDAYLTNLKKDGSPEDMEGFLNGFLLSAKNQMRTAPSTMKNAADETKNIGLLLRTVMDKAGLKGKQLIDQLDIAGDMDRLRKAMPTTAGSPTQALGQESLKRGTGGSILNTLVTGMPSPQDILNAVTNITSKTPVRLTPDQNLEIVKVLFSTKPEVVRKALTDETGMAQLGDAVGKIIDNVLKGSNRPIQQQATQEVMNSNISNMPRQVGSGLQQGLMELIR
jgi:hypothetical protein